MDKLNTVLYNSSLGIEEQDTSTIEAFSSLQNYYRAIAPYNTEWIPYAIFYPTNSDNNVGVPAEYLVMENIDTTTIDGETYYVYETNFPSAVVGSARANKIDVTLAFIAKAEDLIGVARYDEDAVGYNDTTYIASQLLIDYPDAVTDNYVRVFNTETDWLFNGTAWTDTDDITVTELEEHRSDTATYTLRKGTSTSRPTHAPNNTESIIAILNTKISSTEAYDQFYTKTNADLRFVNVTGDTMSGNLNMGGNSLTNVDEVNAVKVTIGDIELTENTTDGTIDMKLSDDVTVQLAQELNQLMVNKSGGTLTNMTPVWLSGVTGNKLNMDTIDISVDEQAKRTKGLITQPSIADNASGYVSTFGFVRGLDTSAFTDNDDLWVSASGGLTATKPLAPLNAISMGVVVYAHAVNGVIFVGVERIPKLQELSDVYAPTMSDGDVLKWNATNSRFEVYALDSILNDKVDKSTTIAGVDLEDDIPTSELLTAVGNATESVAGFLSAEDKRRLNLIYLSYGELADADDIVNTLTEMIEILSQYPEGVDLVDVLASKLNKDFDTLTNKATLNDNDLFVIGDSVNGFANKKTSWAQILATITALIPTKTSDLTNDGDGVSVYVTANDLGEAGYGDMTELEYAQNGEVGVVDKAVNSYKTSKVLVHTAVVNSGADVYIDDKAMSSGEIITIQLPVIASDDDLRISTNGSSGTYITVLSDSNTMEGSNYTEERIELLYNGTNLIYLNVTNAIYKSLPYVGSLGQFALTKDGSTPAIVGQTSAQPDNVYGSPINTQLVSNPDFQDGTTGWLFNNSTGSVTSGILSFTATATSGGIRYDDFSIISGTRYYAKALVKSDSSLVAMNNYDGTTDNLVYHSGSGNYEMLTQIFTAQASVTNDFIVQIVDTRSSGWTQVDISEYQIIPVPDGITTVAEMEKYLDGTVLDNGLHWAGKAFELDNLLDNRNEFSGYDTLDATVDKETSQDEVPYLRFDGSSVANIFAQNDNFGFEDNTTYTLFYHLIENKMQSDFRFVRGSFLGISDFNLTSSTKIGIGKHSFTTATVTTDSFQTFLTVDSTNNGTLAIRYTLVEGDWTNYPFTDAEILDFIKYNDFGAKEFKGIRIKSTQKNLFNKLNITQDTRFNGVGNITTASTNSFISDYIPVKAGETYYRNEYTADSRNYVARYDVNKNDIGTAVIEQTTVITEDGYIRFGSYNTVIDTQQLELGTVATDYEEYETDILHINGELLSDRDNLDYQTDKRDYNDVVQSATTWAINRILTNTHTFEKDLTGSLNYKINAGGVTPNAKLRIGSDIFTAYAYGTLASLDVENTFSIIDSGSGSAGQLAIRVNKTTYPNTASFETYLQANDVEFIYELETAIPRTEENNNVIDVDGQLLIGAKNTYEYSSNGVIGKFYATVPLDKDAQIFLNSRGLIEKGKEIVEVQDEVDKINIKLDNLNIGQEDDLRFSATTIRQGVSTKPDFDITDVVLLFPQNDTSEIVYINAQMPHSWAEGTDIEPHIHFIQEANQQAVFKIDYRWVEIGDTVPASWTTYTMDTYAVTYVSGDTHQLIYGSSPIDGSGYTASSILQIKLYRDDNVYTGDCKVIEFDIHYKVGSLGKDV